MKKILVGLLLVIVAQINAQVPSPKDFLGYELGSHFTPHYKIANYFQAAAKAATLTMKLEQYGTTNGGRPLYTAFISSPENMANLEKIRLNNLQLASGQNAAGSTANAPAIVWLSYNVHGNEPASSEAAMMTLYELLNPLNPKINDWLKNTVVIIDPCINPDGRDRYVNWYNGVVGMEPNPERESREHAEPWPRGRTNYYNFDMNRDWAWQTQVETQQRMKQYNRWMPQVHCDYHEQGYNQPYYFAPAAEPFHEVITPWQREFQGLIGRNHAKYFDANGWLYFTKERFDLLYPSYGDTWPLYNGAIGMTYEQGGISAGLAVVNADGDTVTLRNRVLHHFTTGISTIEMASVTNKKLLDNFQKFFSDANAKGVGEYKTFALQVDGNENKIEELKQMLVRNGIVTGYANLPKVSAYNFFTGKNEAIKSEGSYLVISTMQPRGNLVKVLFEPRSKLTDSATYDITAWSLPYVYGIAAYALKEKVASVNEKVKEPMATLPIDNYGYIVKWNSFESAKFLSEMLQLGIKPRYAEKAFFVGNKNYDAGSLIFIKTSNHKVVDFSKAITQAAQKYNLDISAISSGFVDRGADFGSPDVKTISMPLIACLTGEGTNSLAAGEVWHYFEKEIKYPLTLINANETRLMDWRKIDVLIVPDGNYKNLFDTDGALKTWVKQGGKLVVLENAVNQLADAAWGLTAKKTDDKIDLKKDKDDYAYLRTYGNAERDALVESNPGSIYKVELDNTHPMAFGYPNYYYTLKQNQNVYEFMKDGWNVGVIKKDNQISGFTGVKAREKLRDGVLFGQLNMGRGSIVFYADDVLFRSFWENGKLLFANGLFMVK